MYLFTIFSIVSQLDKRIADFSMFFKPDVKTREDCLSQVMFYLINQQKKCVDACINEQKLLPDFFYHTPSSVKLYCDITVSHIMTYHYDERI